MTSPDRARRVLLGVLFRANPNPRYPTSKKPSTVLNFRRLIYGEYVESQLIFSLESSNQLFGHLCQ